MDGFTYVNIFDTKGFEYIVIIIFLLLLIPFSLILNDTWEAKTKLRKAMRFISDKINSIPHGHYFTKNHTWTHLEKSGDAVMGLDEILLHLTGEVTVNYLKGTGDIISKGDLVAEITHNSHKLRIFSPISGRISGINSLLTELPELINEDPYNKGWLYAIRPSDWKSETHHYFLADEAKQWLKMETDKMKDFLAIKSEMYSPGTVAITLQDGGELGERVLTDMPEQLWQDFQKEFLDPE